MVVQAAFAKRHVVCEKPIALSVQDGLEMIAACDQAGVRFFVAMVVRFFPQYRLSRELVVKGQIGKLGVMRLLTRLACYC
ncbi:Gfo/Idh/MocA family oxidoreductase [Meiothermus sp.]|uniref:Gfo/Idh/MocA family protein n=1 Tax=Meiothermus sp. TaxID=1955249 RepID=UPI00307F9CC7